MNKVGKFLVWVGIAVFFFSCASKEQQNTDAISSKVEKLLAQMTLEEKIGQLNQIDAGYLSDDIKGQIAASRIGSLINCPTDEINKAQKIAIEQSRLGIPLIMARDVIHGYKTIMPIPLGQAASFNPNLVKQAAQVAAKECSSVGIKYTFAPMIDISRDARWGRIAESFGEDTYLTSVMGVAVVEGFQGQDLAAANSVAACAKHFAGYGYSESGRDYNTVDVSDSELRNVILPPFKALADAKVATFMTAFNDLNGIPASGDPYLLKDILRKEWHYKGMVISDYFSIDQMKTQYYAEDFPHTAELAIKAGVDMDMMSKVYVDYLDSLVSCGKVDEKLITEACRNVLTLKYKLGLFDNPYVDTTQASCFYASEHLAVAKQAAVESAVLLKNENNTLPLKKEIRKIAVFGPLADAPFEQVGTWCFDAEQEHSVTPLTALKAEFGENNVIYQPLLSYSRDKNKSQFYKAYTAALRADAMVVFVGEEAILSGEGKCRADISLPGAQSQLIEMLSSINKPLIMVVMAGRPLTIGKEIDLSNAVLFTFHSGTMAGPAISDLLVGKANPSGKLPVTFPKMVGQVPIYYNQKETGRPATWNVALIDSIPVGAKQTSLGFCSYWVDAGVGPLYEFGYGLSYTQFEYADLVLSKEAMGKTDSVTVSCTVKNTGEYAGAEIVQLYVQDKAASLIRPMKELKGFEKIYLLSGESRQVSFTLKATDLAFWNNNKQFMVEEGAFDVYIAPSSKVENGLKGQFVIQ